MTNRMTATDKLGIVERLRWLAKTEPCQFIAAIPEAADKIEADGALIEELVGALEDAREFIVNGVALGFIRMPDHDTPDKAHKTLPAIEAALAKVRPQ